MGAERGELARHRAADAAEPDHEHAAAGDERHRSARAPDVRALVGEQARQLLGAGEHAEHGELGERLGVHARRGRERDAREVGGIEPGLPDLGTAAGRGRVHPAQSRVRRDRAVQLRGRLVGHAVEGVGRVDEPLESGLLLGRAPERRVAAVVAGVQLRRQQRRVAHEFEPGLRAFDELAERLGKGGRDDDAQLAHDAARLGDPSRRGRRRGIRMPVEDDVGVVGTALETVACPVNR